MKDLSYGVRELQAQIGKVLRSVQEGDRVTITSHGRAIATIVKLEGSSRTVPALERKLRRLASEGKIVLGDPSPIADYVPPPIHGLSKQILRDRR